MSTEKPHLPEYTKHRKKPVYSKQELAKRKFHKKLNRSKL